MIKTHLIQDKREKLVIEGRKELDDIKSNSTGIQIFYLA